MIPVTRALCLFLGLLMLLVGTRDLLLPRARYVSSNPGPGIAVSSPPAAVTVIFSNVLSPKSEIRVTSTVTLSQSGEKIYSGGKKITAASGIDPADPQHRTLRADLESGLPRGLYMVDWRAVVADGSAERFGKFYFGVGMQVPTQITREMGGPLRERDYQWRGRQATLLGGATFIMIGLVLPRLMRLGKRDISPHV